MKRLLALMFVLTLTLAGPANGSVQKGDAAIEFMGGWAMENGAGPADSREAFLSGETGADLDGWSLSAAIGRFTSDHFEIGLTGFGTWVEGSSGTVRMLLVEGFPGAYGQYDADVDVTAYGAGGHFRWHFAPANRVVPYLGAQVLWATADVDISGTYAVVTEEGTVLPGTEGTISESDSADGILWGPIAGLRCQLNENNDLLVEYQYHLWDGDIGDVIEDGHAVFIGISHRFK